MDVYQPRFKTVNYEHFPAYDVSTTSTSFHFLPRLPIEIRLRIWKFSIPARRRLFTIRLTQSSAAPGNGLAGGYSISVEQPPRVNALFRVCRESREAVQEWFRLPLVFDDFKILWLSPESDHLFLTNLDIKASVFINFLNDLRVTDPKKIGLLHIAFDSLCQNSLSTLKALSRYRSIPRDAQDSFGICIAQLRSVWFIHLLPSQSRVDLGLVSGSRNFTIFGYNRSMPIFPHAVEFDLLALDPRPIESSLKGQTVWQDPNHAVQAWIKMERKLGFHKKNPKKAKVSNEVIRKISHVLAMAGRSGYKKRPVCDVRCAQTMDKCLQLELENLKSNFAEGPYAQYSHLYWQEVEEGQEHLLSVAGFWVFPQGTFDTVNDTIPSIVYKDLSGLQPGLGVFEL